MLPRKGGATALEFLAEKAEKERKLKEEGNRLEGDTPKMEKEWTDKFIQQLNDMLTTILDIQRQKNNQIQTSEVFLIQQREQALSSL